MCEAEHTERVYFKSFKDRIPAETIFLEAVGTGIDPLDIVERAVRERNALAVNCGKEVDEVWVVFDKDDSDKSHGKVARFERAIELAEKEKFKLAFSNEVFELWLLLHLNGIDPEVAIPRNDIYNELQRLIRGFSGYENFSYAHGNSDILEKIAVLGDEQAAFKRADILEKHHVGKRTLLDTNPMTLVHRLINSLYSWIAYYSYE
ncbi:RloB family protein [Pedobacter sp. AW31-3R]|uniref:RloB family protein n=1 Tax=Pedobacter sp. AW31-3R TaxID=3445781 RepID=UPI003F9F1D85